MSMEGGLEVKRNMIQNIEKIEDLILQPSLSCRQMGTGIIKSLKNRICFNNLLPPQNSYIPLETTDTHLGFVHQA